MNRIALVVVLTLALVTVPARGLAVTPALATDGPALVSMTEVPDGATVSFEGEVISELLAGGDGHRWVNVLSAGTGIGVWAPVELTSEIEVFGDWRHTGDIVRVTGVLNHACDAHGGDLDVHATDIRLVSRGVRHERPWSWWKALGGLGGLAVAYLGYRRTRRQEEKRWE